MAKYFIDRYLPILIIPQVPGFNSLPVFVLLFYYDRLRKNRKSNYLPKGKL